MSGKRAAPTWEMKVCPESTYIRCCPSEVGSRCRRGQVCAWAFSTGSVSRDPQSSARNSGPWSASIACTALEEKESLGDDMKPQLTELTNLRSRTLTRIISGNNIFLWREPIISHSSLSSSKYFLENQLQSVLS